MIHGKLTIIESAKTEYVTLTDGTKRGFRLVKCRCACGEIVIKRKIDVTNGKVESCGCLIKEMAYRRTKKPQLKREQLSFLSPLTKTVIL